MVAALLEEAERLVAEGVEARLAAADPTAAAEAEADRQARACEEWASPPVGAPGAGAALRQQEEQCAARLHALGAAIDKAGREAAAADEALNACLDGLRQWQAAAMALRQKLADGVRPSV